MPAQCVVSETVSASEGLETCSLGTSLCYISAEIRDLCTVGRLSHRRPALSLSWASGSGLLRVKEVQAEMGKQQLARWRGRETLLGSANAGRVPRPGGQQQPG